MKSAIKLLGIITLAAVIGFGMGSCVEDDGKKTEENPVDLTLVFYGKGNPYVDPLDSLSTAERWNSNYHENLSFTFTHEVDSEGVCKITVDGTALPPIDNNGDGIVGYWNSIWKAQACYDYTPVAGKTYTYTFEAKTDGVDRAMVVQWYYDGSIDYSQSPDYLYHHTNYIGTVSAPYPPKFKINSTWQTYSITSYAPLPKSGVQYLTFQCANQTGTFYVKNISIKEAEQKKITITGINGKTGKKSYIALYIDYDNFIAEGFGVEITGSSVTDYLQASVYTNKNNNEYGGWTGTGLVNGIGTPVLTFENKDGSTDGPYVLKDQSILTTSTFAFNKFVKE